MMSRIKPYSVDSLKRALEHHKQTGALSTFIPPLSATQGKWVIYTAEGRDFEMTEAQVYGVCIGLRSAEIHYNKEMKPNVV